MLHISGTVLYSKEELQNNPPSLNKLRRDKYAKERI